MSRRGGAESASGLLSWAPTGHWLWPAVIALATLLGVLVATRPVLGVVAIVGTALIILVMVNREFGLGAILGLVPRHARSHLMARPPGPVGIAHETANRTVHRRRPARPSARPASRCAARVHRTRWGSRRLGRVRGKRAFARRAGAGSLLVCSSAVSGGHQLEAEHRLVETTLGASRDRPDRADSDHARPIPDREQRGRHRRHVRTGRKHSDARHRVRHDVDGRGRATERPQGPLVDSHRADARRRRS